MNQPSAKRWAGWFLILGLAGGLGGVAWWQHAQAQSHRTELAGLRSVTAQLPSLETEHARLLAAQVSPDVREQLRSDHAAIERLRAELAAIKAERAGRRP